jgi:hypothetical protein
LGRPLNPSAKPSKRTSSCKCYQWQKVHKCHRKMPHAQKMTPRQHSCEVQGGLMFLRKPSSLYLFLRFEANSTAVSWVERNGRSDRVTRYNPTSLGGFARKARSKAGPTPLFAQYPLKGALAPIEGCPRPNPAPPPVEDPRVWSPPALSLFQWRV